MIILRLLPLRKLPIRYPQTAFPNLLIKSLLNITLFELFEFGLRQPDGVATAGRAVLSDDVHELQSVEFWDDWLVVIVCFSGSLGGVSVLLMLKISVVGKVCF